ncbi:MAG: hypothetical protein VX000_03570 [Myxococcota bacterium]|nr:hypothetical protein [Myxococcota bacterium]
MSRPLVGVALPRGLHEIAAAALADWGELETTSEHAAALAGSPGALYVLAASSLDDLTAAEQIRATWPESLVCLLAADGMTDRLAVHCLHPHRAQLVMGPPIQPDRLRDMLRPLMPSHAAAASVPDVVDPTEELELAQAIAEDAALESGKLHAAVARHKRAAEAAHQDLAQTRKLAADDRRRAAIAAAQRDAAVAERDTLAVDVTALREEANAARLAASQLAQELAGLEAAHEQSEAEASWNARASEAAKARIDELERAVAEAEAAAGQAIREREAEQVLTKAARAEAAALRAAGPDRAEALEAELAKTEAEVSRLQETLDRDRAESHELRIALTRQQRALTALEGEARRLRSTVEERDERAAVLVEGLRRAEARELAAAAAREAAEADAADARAQQLQDITWFMEELRKRSN